MCVGNFLYEFHRSIKDYDDLFEADYWLQLRDHKGNVIDHDTQLRKVRNMTGTDGQYSEYWYKKDDEIAEVKDEIENAIDGLNLEEYHDLRILRSGLLYSTLLVNSMLVNWNMDWIS